MQKTEQNKPATNLETGLSNEEARKKLAVYGYNEIPEKKENVFLRFLGKFWGITPWMLEATVILELTTGKYVEAYIVLVLLVFNAVLGFFEEEKANGALALLRQKLQLTARVKRNGEWISLSAREVVPGDIIRLRAGDFAPADIKVAEGRVEADQSALTGESFHIDKKAGDEVFGGSTLVRGEVTGTVTRTGAKTYFGRTVELVQTAKPKIHIEKVSARVARGLLLMVAFFLPMGVIAALARGISLLEIVPLIVILLVASVPVALPTMFAISMALGARELSRKGLLLTRLEAVEDSATMDVLCLDKTGTITMNRISVADVLPAQDFSPRDVLLYGALASNEANQDPIDLAFIRAAKERKLDFKNYRQKEFIPFDPATRRTETKIENSHSFIVMKGAFDVIASLCRNQEKIKNISASIQGFSEKGYRILAVAQGETKEHLDLVGIAVLLDEPRPDAPALIKELESLGISVKMLTGDALPIAREIARKVGLRGPIISMSELRGKPDSELPGILEESSGFAEIYPEDKFRLVKMLQAKGHIVGMTGDGVNDAPALKQAEVGIAVKNATDIAKKAASVVITIEGLQGIVELVKSGRRIYQRVITWIINKILRTFKRVVFIVLAFLIMGEFAVSEFSMVLLLLFSDYVTLSLSTDNVRYSIKPDTWRIGKLIKVGAALGIFLVLESLAFFYIGVRELGTADLGRLQTFVFDFLAFAGYFTVLTVRERGHFWTSRPGNLLLFSIGINIVIIFALSISGIHNMSPVNFTQCLFALAYSFLTCLLLNDWIKIFMEKKMGLEF